MRGLGQIAWLASFAKPDIGLITNIAPVHLELVGTVENVARAKAELIEALPPGGTAVVPDEPLLEPYLNRSDITIRRFGTAGAGGEFRVGKQTLRIETSYRAQHQLQNTLAALTVCDVLGIPLADGVLEVEFSPLREEVLELDDGITLIDDSYNANPVSMIAALEHLSALAGGRRRVAVLGEMAELGPETALYHEEVGRTLAALGVEALVTVGPLASAYAHAAPCPESSHAATADEALELVRSALRPGDVVLVKGSRSVGLDGLVAKLRDDMTRGPA